MSTEELLEQLRLLDIRLSLDGDRLRCSAPKGRLTPEIERRIEEQKPEIIRTLRRDSQPLPDLIPRSSDDSPAPLSFGQERLRFLQLLEPENPAYNITAHVRLPAPVEKSTLQAALREVMRRQQALRTKFQEINGACLQIVQQDFELPFSAQDLRGVPGPDVSSAIDRAVREQTKRPFDLAQELPVRVTLLQIADNDSVIILTLHHVIADEWSVGAFFNDLRLAYEKTASGQSDPLPDLPVQYTDYARWQRSLADSDSSRSDLAYWVKKLQGAPAELALPHDRPRPAVSNFEGQVRDFNFDIPDSEKLRQLARHEGVTLFMALLAVFKATLYRYTGEQDIVVGTPFSTRTRPELEPLIGFFVNTLVMRTQISPQTTARELFRDVRETVLEADAHKEVSFERLVQEIHSDRSGSHSPIFQVAFVQQAIAQQVVEQAKAQQAEFEMASAGAIFDMTLYFREVSGRISGSLEYSTALFDVETIDRFLQHFCNLAAAMVANPDQSISSLSFLTAEENAQLLEEWSGSATQYPKNQSVQELFAGSVKAYSNKIAVEVADPDSPKTPTRLTYAELDHRSNQLARYLTRLGAAPSTRVGISLNRGIEAIVAILAILKTGAAYVPLDPAYPPPRLDFMLHDAGIEILVSVSSLRKHFSNYRRKLVCLDEFRGLIDSESKDPIENLSRPTDMAYLMYTSGSTGQPKGVSVPHRAIVRLVRDTNYVEFSPEDVFLACAPISFDASTFEIWGSLLNGARLVLLSQPVPIPKTLAAAIQKFGVTTLWLTSGLFHQMVEMEPDALAAVRQVLAGGDVLSVKHVNKLRELLRPNGVLINGYGPTENTTFTCCYRITKSGDPIETSVPIGKPIANTRVYVLDANLQPVPVGVRGELFIGGDGLALGYWNRPDLTGQKFVADPFDNSPHARLYRTGDIVRRLPDGNLEFVGRRDNQVKIRGFRIELEEIEDLLLRHPGVQEGVVLAQPDVLGSKSLICYYVPKKNPPEGIPSLRSFLSEKLPTYMVPSAFFELPSLPLTPFGKVDRNALRPVQRTEREIIPPRTPLETQLATVWEQVLNVREISVTDDFFALGGHSLLAVKLFGQLEKVFGVVPLAILFEAPTIEKMAEKLSRAGFAMPWNSLVAIQTGGARPPLFLVPGIGGNVLGYSDLARHLGPEQPVYGLQSLGLDGQQKPLDRVEDIAAHFLAEIRAVQPAGPYYLGGACMGGTVAFEMAQQLRASGEQVSLLTLIETWPPHSVEAPVVLHRGAFDSVVIFSRRLATLFKNLRRGVAEGRVPMLRKKMGAVKDFVRQGHLSSSSQMDIFRERVERANHRAMLQYAPRPYDGSILLFLAGARAMNGKKDPRLTWADLATGGCPIYKIDASDSGWILKEPHVAKLAKNLKRSLEEGQPV